MSAVAYAQAKRVENLHLTRERDRRRGRELATYLLAGLPLACALFVCAAMHVEMVRIGYARETRVKLFSRLDEENRRLRADLALTAAPARVLAVAARKGLRPPRPGQIQYVETAAGAEAPR